jgi:hypothetical protein
VTAPAAYLAALAMVAVVVIGAAREVYVRQSPEARHARRGARPVDVKVRALPRAPDEWTVPAQSAIPTETVRLYDMPLWGDL